MSKAILLADDSATIRRVVELTFSDQDYHVVCVASGAEALRRLEELRPDLVLADVVMPGPSGYEICRQIKSSQRPVPVLLLAGTFEAFDHEAARACGADGCLLKPFESRTLIARATSLLQKRDAVTESAIEPLATWKDEGERTLREGTTRPNPDVGRAASDQEAAGEDEAGLAGEKLPAGIEPEMIDAIARVVLRRLSTDVVREIAREVVPGVAETVVRQRILEIENEES